MKKIPQNPQVQYLMKFLLSITTQKKIRMRTDHQSTPCLILLITVVSFREFKKINEEVRNIPSRIDVLTVIEKNYVRNEN